jgi:hypothetical protein
MTDAPMHPATAPSAHVPADQAFDRLNPSFGADHAAQADDKRGLRLVEDGLARGWAVPLSEHYENTGPSQWRRQHVTDRAYYAGERAAQAVRAAEGTFTQLNPDFGVLPDARHAGQHTFAQQREAALALGTRAAIAVMQEQHPDHQQRQAAITARARSAARQGRDDRLRRARRDRSQPAARRTIERTDRRSPARRTLGQREEERSR